ncbi:hypothetical protein [Streptomyces flavofungini]|uniref:Uncharacterized protein n=1 Tax=Streptomyces flavofungini TaxID=68200 RepID=A0ABS0XIS7_9ACTN|nr:hypothetical protein [Streptomyces flavofungini]MBJ3813127.1 hypothetical protein [Streptomyces flavofungini]GHC89447.1 hypothetical protein GCM10010349_77260 [Streptomyces flavofungini]
MKRSKGNAWYPRWELTGAPMSPQQAFNSPIRGRVTHELNHHHDIQLAVAPRLLRPMLYDLASTGLWERHTTHGYYRLTDGQCHTFEWNNTGAIVEHYKAGHADDQCPKLTDPPRETSAWLPHFDNRPPLPPSGTPHGWRGILRRAASLPLAFLPPAVAFYGRYHFGHQDVGAATFAHTFHAMADEALTVYGRWETTPGHHFVQDSSGLIWSITTASSEDSAKPAVTGIYPPRGAPADHPEHQRANRASGSPTLATRRRPA